MVLLFLCVWAIVIAINEVLFAAQPFSLTSIADAMPHTLMFSVVLSAAVYLAKKKIVDALSKGQRIDKRFVAELTPQVGHELNTMRRRMAGEDESNPKTKASPKKAAPQPPKHAKRINPYTAAVNAARTPGTIRRERESYQRPRAYGERSNPYVDPKLRRAEEGLAALDALNSMDRPMDAPVPTMGRDSSTRSFGTTSGSNSRASNLSTGSKAFFNNLKQDEAAKQQAISKAKLQAKKKAEQTIAERKAQLAQTQEQLKQRRRAQLDALTAISQEEQAKAAAKQAAQQKKLEEQQRQRKLQESQRQHQEKQEFAQLKQNLNPFARKDEVKSKTAKLADQAHSKTTTAESGEERAHGEQGIDLKTKAQDTANKKNAVIRETRIAKPEPAPQEPTHMAYTAEDRAQHRAHLERLQSEAKINAAQLQQSNANGGSGDDTHVPSFLDNIELPHGSNIDTSALKRKHAPKQGAGLDTSALKKATLSPGAQSQMRSGVQPLTLRTAQSTGSNGLAGTKMLHTTAGDQAGASNSMLKRTGNVGVNTPQGHAQYLNDLASAAAMSTTLENDATIGRGRVKPMDLAEFQANARARALARAQAPKTTMQQHVASMASNGARKGQPTATTNADHAGSAKVLGHASTLGLNNARGSLPTQTIPSDQAPIRKVINTSIKPMVGPHRDTLPKVLPSPGIAAIQTPPRIRSKAKVSRRASDTLLKREQNFVNAAAAVASTGTVGATNSNTLHRPLDGVNDKIHSQTQAKAYNQMQSQVSGAGASAGSGVSSVQAVSPTAAVGDDEEQKRSQRRPRLHPSDKLRGSN